jgi:hypothetical protein
LAATAFTAAAGWAAFFTAARFTAALFTADFGVGLAGVAGFFLVMNLL